jgi:hypothetical protein
MVKRIGLFLEQKYFYRLWAVFIVTKGREHAQSYNTQEFLYVGNSSLLIEMNLTREFLLIVYSLDKSDEHKNCSFRLIEDIHNINISANFGKSQPIPLCIFKTKFLNNCKVYLNCLLLLLI